MALKIAPQCSQTLPKHTRDRFPAIWRLFKILDDEFKIDIVSFDADDESEGPNELYGKGDNYHDIMAKVKAMILKRRKKN